LYRARAAMSSRRLLPSARTRELRVLMAFRHVDGL
jgi:hypothetical protein